MNFIETLEPMPMPENPEQELNPFHHDLFSMGTRINNRFTAMYGTNENEVIIVDIKTGKRVKLVA
jgi:hypothetical protein